ncbi:transaldolase [Longimicrobium sp.]|uniref:transaldolase n=1 Tax=Longimicrobium sp. TaxID=2029185 RepID=UPI002E37ADE3|nr:transaldolase [Longimicrobium sp.]HEX6036568.1 transaldolase [Longimicrobium sp.]
MTSETKHPTDAVDAGRNPLHELHGLGQSVWLDYIRRGILDNGELEEMIRRYDLRGVTSNPSIFEQAIGDSDDYDDAFDRLAAGGSDGNAAYESLAVDDISRACDLFRGVYDASNGTDGFVSLEVSPTLAHDTQGTVDEARRLWKAVNKPNLMIKVPGTDAGLPAIEQLLAEGMNVNITLLFSVENHEKVMEAYLRGLERRQQDGGALDRIGSVASFFVSRVDSAVDGQLEKIAASASDDAAKQRALGLRGKAAIANAKLAYARFQEIFSGERWERLAAAGANVQRPLWASTSTKNPDYRDVIYVEELIGPHTVNTMPLATVEAFADHGVARSTVDQDVEQARADLAALEDVGIDMDAVTDQLQREGVEKFAKSFAGMLTVVGEKLSRVAQK